METITDKVRVKTCGELNTEKDAKNGNLRTQGVDESEVGILKEEESIKQNYEYLINMPYQNDSTLGDDSSTDEELCILRPYNVLEN